IPSKFPKDVQKEMKKSVVIPAGVYWNGDRTQLHQFSGFVPKGSESLRLAVLSVDEKGSVEEAKTMAFSPANLKGYELQTFESATEKAKLALNGYETAFIRNPTLAGSPTIIRGKFVDRYKNGLWIGYKFEKSAQSKMEDRFWRFVSFPLGEEMLDQNHYLLQPPSLLGKAWIAGRRYLPARGRAYIGGLKAVSGSNIFLSGIFNLGSAQWEHQQDIDLGMKMRPDLHSWIRHGEHTSILLGSTEAFKLLQLDSQGQKQHLVALRIPQSGGKSNQAPSIKLHHEGNTVYAFASVYQGLMGKNIGLSVSSIENGQETQHWTFDNATLAAKAQLPAKQKIKLGKLKFMQLQQIKHLQNGDFLVLAQARNEKLNAVEMANLAIQIGMDGSLKACYLMDGLKPPKDEQLSQEQEMLTDIIETQDGFYWLVRGTLKGDEQGVKVTTEELPTVIRTTTFRIDDTITIGQLARVNTQKGSISNMIQLEGKIYGAEAGAVSQSGSLALSSTEGIVIVR
ncbi:MAG: hypothetical protein AAF206_28735, partial [Bacteroidota bacterium]